MNARKYAWQILHAEIRRRVNWDDVENPREQQQLQDVVHLISEARKEVGEFDLIFELAGFGATYAMMPRTDNDPISVAKRIEQEVMSEPDDGDDG